MEKEKIIICDFCEKKISNTKCPLCSKDYCEDCVQPLRLKLTDGLNDEVVTQIGVCENCGGKILESNLEIENKRLEEELVAHLKNALIIDGLTEKPKEPITLPQNKTTTPFFAGDSKFRYREPSWIKSYQAKKSKKGKKLGLF